MNQGYSGIDYKSNQIYLKIKSCNKGITFTISDDTPDEGFSVTLDFVSTGVLTSQLLKFAMDLLEKKGDREFFKGFNI